MTKEDYRNLIFYLDCAADYLGKGNIPAASTEIQSTKTLLENIRTKKSRARIAIGPETKNERAGKGDGKP